MQQKEYLIEQLDSDILAISPIEADKNSLYLLTQHGDLYRYHISEQQLKKICIEAITLPILNHRELRHYGTPMYDIKCSANGKFVAIFVNYGQFGIVIDIEKQQTILNIDTQNYHEDTVPFSLAFTTFEHDDIVIYRSDWNRLETFNLSKSISKTERYIAPYERDNRPKHYLDYFHGALYVSPTGEYLLDDGWIWQGIAITHLWSLTDWFSKNSFESEDDSSLQSIAFEEEGWDYPICWLDDHTFAMWQMIISTKEHDGTEGYESITCPHIRINTISSDQTIQSQIWKLPEQTQTILNMYADDDKLMIIGNENISNYDISTRTLLKQIDNHLSQKQHKKRKSLFSYYENTIFETQYAN